MFLDGYSEDLHAWLIEAGTYGIWIGSHAESLQLVEQFTVHRQTVLEQIKKLDSENAALTREQTITELTPLLYGNITGGNSMLGSAGGSSARFGRRNNGGIGGKIRYTFFDYG